jgi:hypothetical protein
MITGNQLTRPGGADPIGVTAEPSKRGLTRDQLYELVWSQPVRTVAERFGMSDRGLAKLCERHAIPVPGRGYWRLKETGHRVRRLPLPKLHPNHQKLAAVRLPEPQAIVHPGQGRNRHPIHRASLPSYDSRQTLDCTSPPLTSAGPRASRAGPARRSVCGFVEPRPGSARRSAPRRRRPKRSPGSPRLPARVHTPAPAT